MPSGQPARLSRHGFLILAVLAAYTIAPPAALAVTPTSELSTTPDEESGELLSLGTWSIAVDYDYSMTQTYIDGTVVATESTSGQIISPGVEFQGWGTPTWGEWYGQTGTWSATTTSWQHGSDVLDGVEVDCPVTRTGSGEGSDVAFLIGPIEPMEPTDPYYDSPGPVHPHFYGLDHTVGWTELQVAAGFESEGLQLTQTSCRGSSSYTEMPFGWVATQYIPVFLPETVTELLAVDTGQVISGGYSGERASEMNAVTTRETFEVAFTVTPGEVLDLDGDGVVEGDQCPAQAGPASNDGCPVTTVDCDGEVDRRGYVVAEYDAEVNSLVGDPDVFGFDVSGTWCAVDGVIEMDVVDVQGYESLDPVLGTTLATLGFTFSYDPAASSAIPTESADVGEIVGIGQFDACFDWAALLAGPVGKAAGTLAKQGSRLTAAALRRSGSADEVMEVLVARAEALQARAAAIIEKKVPGGFAAIVNENLDATMQQLEDELEAIVQRGVARGADVDGLRGQARSRAIAAIRASIQDEIHAAVGEALLTAESCFEMWQPIVTITIPLDGVATASLAGYANPLLTVSGGVTIDTRPTPTTGAR